MTKFTYLALSTLPLVLSCSGNAVNDNPQAGGTQAVAGDTSTLAGGASATGGATSAGGFLGLGGTLPANGGASTSTSSTEGSPVNCANVGCAMPPLCSTGCTEACGCCLCSDGTRNGNLVCKGGCWADSGSGGASSTGGSASTGGNSASGGGLGTSVTSVCGTGCTFETADSPFCTKGLVSLFCMGGTDFQAAYATMQTNGCTIGASDAVRFCCPPAILTHCQ